VVIAQLQQVALFQGLFKFRGADPPVRLGKLAERHQFVGVDVGAVFLGIEELD
jgi:hypothetical protein